MKYDFSHSYIFVLVYAVAIKVQPTFAKVQQTFATIKVQQTFAKVQPTFATDFSDKSTIDFRKA